MPVAPVTKTVFPSSCLQGRLASPILRKSSITILLFMLQSEHDALFPCLYDGTKHKAVGRCRYFNILYCSKNRIKLMPIILHHRTGIYEIVLFLFQSPQVGSHHITQPETLRSPGHIAIRAVWNRPITFISPTTISYNSSTSGAVSVSKQSSVISSSPSRK